MNKRVIIGVVGLVLATGISIHFINKWIANTRKNDAVKEQQIKDELETKKKEALELKQLLKDNLEATNSLKTDLKNQSDATNKLNKAFSDYKNSHPETIVSKTEKLDTIASDVNAWYNSGSEQKAFIANGRFSSGTLQTQGLYFDAKNWRFNEPILRTKLDFLDKITVDLNKQLDTSGNIIQHQEQTIQTHEKLEANKDDQIKKQSQLTDVAKQETKTWQTEARKQKFYKWVGVPVAAYLGYKLGQGIKK